MAATLNDIGIQSSGLALLESIDYDKKTEEVVVSDSDSSFGEGQMFNPTVDFSLKGHGDIDALLVIGSDGGAAGSLTGINDGSGTRIITDTTETETNGGINNWDAKGVYYPNATVSEGGGEGGGGD